MNYDILEKYIIDFIQEQQLKIGYIKENIRIYYFLSSLNSYTAQTLSVDEMKIYLEGFCDYAANRMGNIKITNNDERFCFLIPEKGVEYSHKLPLHNEFLPELLQVVSTHGCTMDKIIDTFRKYPYSINIERINSEDFDYLIYFNNHPHDNYRYCFKDEDVHITYHRFTVEDYESTFN